MQTAIKVFDEQPGAVRQPAATLYLASETVTARDLIRGRVEEEVTAFNKASAEVFHGLIQPTGAEQVLNGYRLKTRRPLDSEKQVAAALAAFEANGFILLFDDRQVEDLDDKLVVTPDSVATFVRLVPLVGG